MSLYIELLNQNPTAGHYQFGMVRQFSPEEIRETIQSLLADPSRHHLAHALGDAGMALYPDSEDMLTISGYLAVLRQDWPQVVEYLQNLLEIRAGRTDAATYLTLVRALQMRLDPIAALKVAQEGLRHHPEHPGLLAETTALTGIAHVLSLQKLAH
jgi:uncharacterized protein HemY